MRRYVFTAASAVALITLSACSSSGTSSQSAGSSAEASGGMSMPMSQSPSADASAPGALAAGPHNSADVSFATDMVPHHGQAIEMATMALAKASNAEVKALAGNIQKAQAPEIATMSGWLTGWGAPVPNPSMAAMPGMSMPGEMTAAEMTSLNNATGAAFDTMWLQMMIKHHTGAIKMAQVELTQGQNSDAKRLAQSITTSQTAEIAQMQKLLTTLG